MELGSEYNLSLSDLTVTNNNLFAYLANYNCCLLDSGRSAIKCLYSLLPKTGEFLLPEYMCESVINCFPKKRICFYKITEDFQINIEDLISKMKDSTAAVFIMHYFGSLQQHEILKDIKNAADKHNIIVIEDTTQSLFSAKQTIGDYMVASVRKWLPVSKCGVLYSKHTLPKMQYEKDINNDRCYGMVLKDLFLNGILDCNDIYREIFAECEEKLDAQKDICMASDLTKFIISCHDISSLTDRRKKNYAVLEKEFLKLGIISACSMLSKYCPFGFPLRVKNRDKFRKYLIDNKIYCAVHWPFDGYCAEERTIGVENAQSLISLPVDQRYGTEEMLHLVQVISQYKGIDDVRNFR